MSEQGGSTVRSLRKLLVLVSMVGVFSMLSVGVAFADHTGGTEWTCDDATGALEGNGCAPNDRNKIGPAAKNALAPVGRNIAGPGFDNAFDGGTPSNAFTAIQNNPLCPFHGVEETP